MNRGINGTWRGWWQRNKWNGWVERRCLWVGLRGSGHLAQPSDCIPNGPRFPTVYSSLTLISAHRALVKSSALSLGIGCPCLLPSGPLTFDSGIPDFLPLSLWLTAAPAATNPPASHYPLGQLHWPFCFLSTTTVVPRSIEMCKKGRREEKSGKGWGQLSSQESLDPL